MSGNNIKRMLFYLLFTALCFPLVQHNLCLFTTGMLYGSFELAPKPEFKLGKWLDGSYQTQSDQYVNDNMGFRNDLVRVNNQVDLSLFGLLHTGAILGKDRYLFHQAYIDERAGRRFHGYDSARNAVVRIKYIQDVFLKKGKTFVFIHPSTKDRYCAEFLPYDPSYVAGRPNDFSAYKYFCDSLGIKQIDFNEVFSNLKSTAKGPLFTKQGMHWSLYGALFAVDSIIKYIEHDRNINLPTPTWTDCALVEVPRSPDNDIGWTINLIFPFIKEKFCYPEVSYAEDSNVKKPSAIYVEDSFMWPLIINGLVEHTHSSWEFWYYFNTVYTARSMKDEEPKIDVSACDWKAKLENTDCIIMLYVPSGFVEMNRFVDSVYYHYKEQEAQPLSVSSHSPKSK